MKTYKKEIIGQYKQQQIEKYSLETDNGYRLSVMTYGATVLDYMMPNQAGVLENVVVAYDTFQDYIDNSMKLGATIGPVAGRLANGRFTLNGEVYQLPQNQNGNHLHGGLTGFDSTVFSVEKASDNEIVFYTKRDHLTGGYPGVVEIWVRYNLFETGEWSIHYVIKTNEDTLINPTNHTYFNLTGDLSKGIHQHHLQVSTKGFTVLNDMQIPTGEINTSADFLKDLQQGVLLQEVFNSKHPQIQQFNGIDHAFVLDELSPSALVLSDSQSGRQLNIKTTSPAVVIYTANVYDDKTFFNGKPPVEHVGIAIETQLLPDAINQKGFGDIVLRAGDVFTSTTHYIPSVK